MNSKIAQNLSHRSFTSFGSKRDSPQQINSENFIIGFMVGFQAILDQRQVFTTLEENWIAHALYLSACSCDAMYRVRECKSKLEPFYRMFITFFAIFFWTLGLNTCLNGVWNYRYIYQRDLTPSKCWSGFCYFLRLLASSLHVRQIVTCGRLSQCVLLSLEKTVVSHLKVNCSRSHNNRSSAAP